MMLRAYTRPFNNRQHSFKEKFAWNMMDLLVTVVQHSVFKCRWSTGIIVCVVRIGSKWISYRKPSDLEKRQVLSSNSNSSWHGMFSILYYATHWQQQITFELQETISQFFDWLRFRIDTVNGSILWLVIVLFNFGWFVFLFFCLTDQFLFSEWSY